MNTVEQRLEKLERSINRYRKFTFMLALVIVAGFTLGRTKPDVVDVIPCHNLEVIEKELRTVALLRAWKQGGWLSINDSAGIPKLHAGTDLAGDGVLRVSSKEGKYLIHAGAGTEGNGLSAASWKEGAGRIFLSSGDNGAFAQLYNKA